MEIKIYINLEINILSLVTGSITFYNFLKLLSMKLLKLRVTKPKTVEKRWDRG